MSYFSFWNETIGTENVTISSSLQDWLLSEERHIEMELQKWHRINKSLEQRIKEDHLETLYNTGLIPVQFTLVMLIVHPITQNI